MTLKSILLFAPAEQAAPRSGPAAFAIALARAHGASLTIFSTATDVTTPGLATDAASVAAALADAAKKAGVAATMITSHSHAVGVHEVIAAYARLHDVTVCGCSTEGLLSERIIAEHLLFASGRPLILVPPGFDSEPRHDRLAVAWDDTPSGARALGDALQTLAPSVIILLSVEGEKLLTPLLPNEETMALVVRRGVAIEAAVRNAAGRAVAEVLQAETESLGADMLVMGGFGHSRMRRFLLGSATSGLFDGLRLPTMLSH